MAALKKRLIGAALVGAAALSLAPTQAANAAAAINGPAGVQCNRYPAKISVSAPRVWASYRTEQVLWKTTIERWNSSTGRWYTYDVVDRWASFNIYGQNVTGWSGGSYVNSTMNFGVSHVGYYRLASFVGGTQGGVVWNAYVDRGAYCYIR
jgi:hypothetical protein